MSKIITAGNPDLKRKALPVTAFDKKLKFIISDMKKTLYEANGVGLAAPQIDLNMRLFVADDGETGFEAYVNPVWEPVGDETNIDSEGCLSVPGFVGLVEPCALNTRMHGERRNRRWQPVFWHAAFSMKQIT